MLSYRNSLHKSNIAQNFELCLNQTLKCPQAKRKSSCIATRGHRNMQERLTFRFYISNVHFLESRMPLTTCTLHTVTAISPNMKPFHAALGAATLTSTGPRQGFNRLPNRVTQFSPNTSTFLLSLRGHSRNAFSNTATLAGKHLSHSRHLQLLCCATARKVNELQQTALNR